MNYRMARPVLLAALVVMLLAGFAANSYGADSPKETSLSKAMDQAKIFAGLTTKEKAALRSTATLRRCKEGERIIEQGKPTGKMFIILEGMAEVRVNGKLVAALPQQSLVGELEFLDGLSAGADVVILQETDLIELDNGALIALMEKQPRLGYVLMGEIARIEGRRLRAMNQQK